MTVETFTDIVAWTAFPFGCFVIGVSVVIFAYYLTQGHRYFLHIALMSISYTKMSTLLVLTINYRIFYDGWPRFIGAVILLTAFIEGIVGLLLIFKRRAKDIMHRTEG